MTGALFHLGRFCVRRRWVVIAAWLLVFTVLAISARALGPNVSDNLTLPGTDSHAATDLLEQRFPSQANGTNPVMLRAPQGEKINAAKYKQPIDDTVSALKADPAIRSHVVATIDLARARASCRWTRRTGSSRSPTRRVTPGSRSASAVIWARRCPSPRRTRAS